MSEPTVWTALRQYAQAEELAETWGFYLEQGRNDPVVMRAKAGSGIWADNTSIATFNDFRDVCIYLQGYANAKLHSKFRK